MEVRFRLPGAVTVFALLLAAVTTKAQEPTGIITGIITDASGAVVPGATVTVTNKETGTARTTMTNAEGLYSAPSLLPAQYVVRVEHEGFRAVQSEVLLLAGATSTVNLSITPGAPNEVVIVETLAAQVDYDTHSVGSVIERQTIEDLPLNGRSSLQLATLEPGVTVAPGSTSQFNAMFNVSVFGAAAGATAGGGVGARLTMDGGTINDEMEGGTSMNFSQEIVQEFQISTTNFDASTGIGTEGAINIITRSGSNDFHGSAYFFYRDHNMAAYPGLAHDPLFPNPFFQRKNPGVYLGGPIKKDRLFFFFNYEYLKQTAVLAEQEDLPSVQGLSAIWPEPYHYNLFNVRFDYHMSSKNSFFLRYSHDGNEGFGPYALTPQPASFNYNYNWSDQSIIGWTSVLTPALVNDARFQYKFWENNVTDAVASDCVYPCIGFGLPAIVTMIGSGTFYTGANVNSPQFRQDRAYEAIDTLTWQKGTHRLQFGMDYEFNKTKVVPWDFCDPGCDYVFAPEEIEGILGPLTSFLFPNLPKVINSTQDLLNLPIYNLPQSIYSGTGIGNGTFPGFYEHGQGAGNNRIHPWVADTWKVKPNFTINLGLAYDLETGLFYSNIPLPQYLAPIVNNSTVPGGLGATQSNKLDFAPQVGFAWSPGKSGKTVIRAGGGLYWDTQPIWEHFREGAAIGPPGDGRSTLAASAFTNIYPGILDLSAGGKPIPVGASLPLDALTTMTFGQFINIVNQELPALEAVLTPTPPASGPFSIAGINVAKQGIEIYPSHFPLMHSFQSNIGVQHEFGNDILLTVDWARTQGEHVNLGELDLNHFAAAQGPAIPVCTPAEAANPLAECSTGSITFWTPEGRSVYDALLVKLTKRFSHHFNAVVSYALQKRLSISGTGLVDPVADLFNYFASYGPTLPSQDLNIAGTANLPWGFILSLNSSMISRTPMEPLIQNVDLNGAGDTSYPLSFAVPNVSYDCFNSGCGKGRLQSAVAYWNQHVADPAAGIPNLVLPPNYSLGAPIITQDVRIDKEFVFKERYRFRIFGEFFNLFNISNLSYSNFNLDPLAPGCSLNSNNYSTSCVSQTYAFGQATDRVSQVFGSGGPRAIQVGARFSF